MIGDLRVLGVPSSAGAEISGTDLAPGSWRAAGLVERIQAAGRQVHDLGDVSLPAMSVHHNVPPIRNWPAPRLVWTAVREAVAGLVKAGGVVLLVGGDCSIVVGSTSALVDCFEQVWLIVLDGHIDAVTPSAWRCVGAAAMGLELLTQPSAFHDGPRLDPERIVVVGHSDPQGAGGRFREIPADAVRRHGAVWAATQAMAPIPRDAWVLVHFDVDVLAEADMPAAYSPNPNGLDQATVAEMLRILLLDPRIRLIEVPEYFPPRDLSGECASSLADILARAMTDEVPVAATGIVSTTI